MAHSVVQGGLWQEKDKKETHGPSRLHK